MFRETFNVSKNFNFSINSERKMKLYSSDFAKGHLVNVSKTKNIKRKTHICLKPETN